MPTASSRRATTSSAARFSATNSTRLPSATARVSRLVMVCDLPVPGGPSSTNVRPATASAIARSCEASAGSGQLRGELVEVDAVAGVAAPGRRTPRSASCTRWRDQRVLGEVGPVLVEVLPQPELRELQDREVRRRLDPVGQPVPDQRDPHRPRARPRGRARRRPARSASGRRGRAAGAASPAGSSSGCSTPDSSSVEPVGAGAAERRRASTGMSTSGERSGRPSSSHTRLPERQVEVVGAGLLEHRLRLVGQRRAAAAGSRRW